MPSVKTTGFMVYDIDYTESCIIVNWLEVPVSQRCNKVATRLLYRLSKIACKMGILYVKLDDMSDKYRQYSTNIYCRTGFTYDNSHGGPEMTCSVHDLMTKSEQLLK
jgi:hypothetical protein